MIEPRSLSPSPPGRPIRRVEADTISASSGKTIPSSLNRLLPTSSTDMDQSVYTSKDLQSQPKLIDISSPTRSLGTYPPPPARKSCGMDSLGDDTKIGEIGDEEERYDSLESKIERFRDVDSDSEESDRTGLKNINNRAQSSNRINFGGVKSRGFLGLKGIYILGISFVIVFMLGYLATRKNASSMSLNLLGTLSDKDAEATTTEQTVNVISSDEKGKAIELDVTTAGGVIGKVGEIKTSFEEKVPVKSASATTAAPPAPKSSTGQTDLLGLDQVPRRYRYGANFQPRPIKDSESQTTSSDGGPADDPENDNALVNHIPTAEELAEIFEFEKERYETEQPFWRTYVWEKPRVHESLTRILASLTGAELELYAWTREARQRPVPSSIPVGLAGNHPHRVKVDVSSEQPVDGRSALNTDDILTPNLDEDGERLQSDNVDNSTVRRRRRIIHRHDKKRGVDWFSSWRTKPKFAQVRPPAFAGGSLVKWGRLAEEARGELGGTCAGGTWLQDYKTLHQEMMSGTRPAKVISSICERGINCGGLGDRLLAMTSAFLFGLITDRAFFAEWQTPIPLDIIFDSTFIDWSMTSFDLDNHLILSNVTLQGLSADLDIIHFDLASMDRTFGTVEWDQPTGQPLEKGMERRDLAFRSPWIRFFSNRGMVYRSFSYPHLQTRIHELGLRPLSAFSCILNYLFRPKPAALDFITSYTSVLSLPTIFSIGIQIRTGDASMKSEDYDVSNTVDAYTAFFDCADQLAETYMLPDQRLVYFLVTDSAHLRKDAQNRFGNKVIVSGVGIEHIHVKSGHVDGVYNAVLEEWILAKTDYRVITQDSGFGKLATFASGQRSTTVTIFPSNNPDLLGLLTKQSHVAVDCRLESAFSTFDQIASEWSLGRRA